MANSRPMQAQVQHKDGHSGVQPKQCVEDQPYASGATHRQPGRQVDRCHPVGQQRIAGQHARQPPQVAQPAGFHRGSSCGCARKASALCTATLPSPAALAYW